MEGDGIGPEVSAASVSVLNALKPGFGVEFDFRPSPAGDLCKKRTGQALPDSSLATIEGSDVCLKAPVGETAADVIVKIRQMLDLYANIRPSKTMPRVPSLKPAIDFVIVRENTECLYRGMEFEFEGGVVALRTITRKASERIAKHAFALVEQRKHSNKVVAVHKANVLRKSDGLFAQVCREVAVQHPSVSFSEMLVDAAAMNLIRDPESFDVIVTTNMYGDILSDEAAQLVGGLGLAPSGNIGEKFAIFEPVHGAAPDIAGKGIANPLAMILSTSMMLDWLSSRRGDHSCAQAAAAIRSAVNSTLEMGVVTPDIGGRSTTSEVGAAVAKLLTTGAQVNIPGPRSGASSEN
ncbi:MAG: isocitrate/isopropylmalate dehydrogenase family protein [Thaumarchaeota archaeon]|nr:isocitrate/isopropylmalate dehydrogenase family protein [Nitrososphaerota archaeon]